MVYGRVGPIVVESRKCFLLLWSLSQLFTIQYNIDG